MNTLPKAITGRFFTDTASYEALETRWRELVRAASDRSVPVDQRPRLTAAHHALYAALRGKDYRKGVSEITRQIRLDNGQDPMMPLKVVIFSLHSKYDQKVLLAPFEGIVTLDMLCALRELLPPKLGHGTWWGTISLSDAFPGAKLPETQIEEATEEQIEEATEEIKVG